MKRLCFLFVFVALLFTACSVPIAKIMAESERYDGKEVTVKGKVTSSTDLKIVKFYFLDDGSGDIRVVTKDDDMPAEGESRKVRGVVDQKFKVGSFKWVVIKETH